MKMVPIISGSQRSRGYETIKGKGIEVVVYEPTLNQAEFYNSRVINDLAEFKRISDVILSNRLSDEIKDVVAKVYTRDLFARD